MNGRAMALRVDAALIAPAATPQERLLGYGAGAAGTVFAVGAGVLAGWPPLSLVVIGAVAFDMFGGATVNAMDSAKRWWHRPGRTARHQLAFVAAHIHPFLMAWAVPDFGWPTASAIYLTALTAAALVLATPPQLRRPVSYALATLGLSAFLVAGQIPVAVSWFVPVLLIKLLLAHLQPEHGVAAGPGERGVTPGLSDPTRRGPARN